MLVVWKYNIAEQAASADGRVLAIPFGVEMPRGARILSVGVQANETPVFWALVDPDAPRIQRTFVLVGTGCWQPDELATFAFVGTFGPIMAGLWFHLFDAGEFR